MQRKSSAQDSAKSDDLKQIVFKSAYAMKKLKESVKGGGRKASDDKNKTKKK